ncbi:MAG: diguanylate cyclase [bacterium]|nr:diguanylate cyclase [bacterium]
MIELNTSALFGNFIAVFIYLGVGFFSLFTVQKTKPNLSFILLSLTVGLWCLGPILVNIDGIPLFNKIILQKLCYVFAVLLAPAFFSLVSAVSEQKIFDNIKGIFYIFSSVFISFLFADNFISGLSLSHGLYQTKPGIVYYCFIVYVLLTVGFLLYFLQREYKKNTKSTVLKFLFIGFFIQYLGGGVYFLSILEVLPCYTFSGYIVAFGEFLLFYAIIKFDFTINNEAEQTKNQQYIIETTKRLIELNDTLELSEHIYNFLRRNTGFVNVKIFCLDNEEKLYVNYLAKNVSIESNTCLVEVLTSQHNIIKYSEVRKWASDIKTKNFIDMNQFFIDNSLEYIIPLFFGNLIGFICIGNKQNQLGYTVDDLKIFDLISYSGAIALQKIKLLTNNTIDDLTQLYNKKFFNKELEEQVALAVKENTFFSFLFLDIDNFSKLNERLGHTVCDKILIKFGKLCKKYFRFNDIVARWGGEEIVVILPATKIEDAVKVAENFLQLVRDDLEVTFSCGVVFFDGSIPPKDTKLKELAAGVTKLADENMYQAKNKGKNQVFTDAVVPQKI